MGGRRIPGRRLYSLGEIARATGLARQTLHGYALLGIIRETERTSGGHRRFGARVVRRLDEIRAMKTRFTLAEIRDRLTAGQGGAGRPR